MNWYVCDTCQGRGYLPTAHDGDEPCWKCNGAGDLLLARFDRIAVALEVIAGDITERRERERASLISQYRHLRSVARSTSDRFSSADRALGRDPSDRRQRYANECEAAMVEADIALESFIASHPGIEDLAGDAE